MNMRTTLTLLCTLPFALMAQTNWPVEVGGSLLNPNNLPYYAPQDLVIEVGDIVTWTNVGGSHNVYGELDEYPNNPEGFSNGVNPIQDPWTWPYTFTIPGIYEYKCTGSFNGQFHSTTQFGTITVLDGNSIEESSPWGEVSIFPVPASDVLNLRVATNSRLTIDVYRGDGGVQMKQLVTSNGLYKMDVSTWAAGPYVIRIIDDSGRLFSKPFVVD